VAPTKTAQKELKDIAKVGIIRPDRPVFWLMISSIKTLSGVNQEYGSSSFYFDDGARQIAPGK
jgi:hypothetical protein